MRLARLSLQPYGGFESRELIFAKEAGNGRKNCDLQVIFGPNEAGKSTTRRAVLDFLFGFPHRVQGADWNVPAARLRVGAEVETSAGIFSAWRRRGQKSLYGPDDKTPLSDTWLRDCLPGFEQGAPGAREAYERDWALDHARLREGGAQMLALRRDAGLQVLAAELGTDRLGEVLDDLKQAREKLWKKRASTPEIARRKEQLLTLRKTLGAQLLTPEKLLQARKAVQEAAAEIKRLDGQEAETRHAQVELVRLQALLVPYRHYRAAQTARASRPAPVFGKPEAEEVLALIKKHHQTARELAEDEALCTALQAELAALGPRPALLGEAGQLASLLSEAKMLKESGQRHQDLKARNERLTSQGTTLRRQLQLTATESKPAPDWAYEERGTLEQLQKLQALQSSLMDRQTRLRSAELACRTAEQRLAALPAIETQEDPDESHVNQLEAWLEQALPLYELSTSLEEKTGMQEDRARQLNRHLLARLGPWEAPQTPVPLLEALQKLCVPGLEEIQLWLTRLLQLEAQCARCAQETRQAEEDVAKQQQRLTQLQATGQGVTVADLLKSRQERDARLEEFLQEPAPASWPALRQAVHQADELADRRMQEAETSAALEGAKNTLEQAQLHLAQRKEADRLAQGERRACQQAWQVQLQSAGLPSLAPAAFMSWRERYEEALAKLQDFQQVQQTHRQRLSTLHHLSRQAAHLPGRPVETQELPFRELVAEIRAQLKTERHHETQRQTQRHLHNTATQQVHETRTALELLQQEQTLGLKEWAAACQRLAFPPTLETRALTPENFPAFCQLVQLEAERQRVMQEVRHLQETGARFTERQQALLKRYPAESLQALQNRLQEEQKRDEARRHLEGQLAARQAQSGRLQHLLLVSRNQLDACMARLPYGPMPAGPESAQTLEQRLLQQAQEDLQTAECDRQLSETRARLQEAGRGEALDTLCSQASALTVEGLESDIAALERQLAELRHLREEAFTRQSAARQALAEMESQDDSARIAAEIAQVEAELAELAETYVSLHLQQTLLETLIAREREKSQGPFLQRAGALFSRLTLGQYEGLSLEPQGKSLLLTGQKTGSKTTSLVPSGEMSEGTRDQLYLALRLAHVQQALETGVRLPFLADDLFITFDDERARAGLEILSELAQQTQVLFFTHHRRLYEMGSELGHALAL
ncbi:AAA family ATPase [Oecophyllibacter saccharovorans]|uniref:YhaN AAA domain-containing protein n=1 Tax=Oecophyllibacter saccharovorans TaxID=2558360 RepID=A0A506UKW7_9PROT|nr:AAA family ATPase [Oecophyllibacter saccharovorans]TPW33965.1 hypothetical protein E3202_05180 [Oecophyllibacter saccharovorans]